MKLINWLHHNLTSITYYKLIYYNPTALIVKLAEQIKIAIFYLSISPCVYIPVVLCFFVFFLDLRTNVEVTLQHL